MSNVFTYTATRTTNKSYRFGLNKHQCVGFSENTGSEWIKPEPSINGMSIIDNDELFHNVVIDYRSGKLYDISTKDLNTNTNNIKVWQDKCNISGVNGTDIATVTKFKEDKGEFERFFLRNCSENIYTRPVVYEDGYISGLLLDIDKFVDDSKTTATATVQDISLPKHELVTDRQVKDAHRIQTQIRTNKSKFRIVGKQTNYIVYDKSADPDSKELSEDTWQSNLSENMVMWITRGYTTPINRINNEELVGGFTPLNGPDGKDSSAFRTTTPIQLKNAAITNGTILVWYDTIPWINGYYLTPLVTNGVWTCGYYNGVIDANAILALRESCISSGYFFDLRIYTDVKDANTMSYYYNDVISNNGDNVMPIF